MLYHDPLFRNCIESKIIRLSRKDFYSCHLNLEVSLLLAVWELCLLEKDASLLYFFSYALLVHNKRALLSAPMFAKEALLEVADIAETKDLEALCQQAKHVLQSTPAPLLRAILENSDLPASRGAGVLALRRLDPVGMQFFVVIFFEE